MMKTIIFVSAECALVNELIPLDTVFEYFMYTGIKSCYSQAKRASAAKGCDAAGINILRAFDVGMGCGFQD